MRHECERSATPRRVEWDSNGANTCNTLRKYCMTPLLTVCITWNILSCPKLIFTLIRSPSNSLADSPRQLTQCGICTFDAKNLPAIDYPSPTALSSPHIPSWFQFNSRSYPHHHADYYFNHAMPCNLLISTPLPSPHCSLVNTLSRITKKSESDASSPSNTFAPSQCPHCRQCQPHPRPHCLAMST